MYRRTREENNNLYIRRRIENLSINLLKYILLSGEGSYFCFRVSRTRLQERTEESLVFPKDSSIGPPCGLHRDPEEDETTVVHEFFSKTSPNLTKKLEIL